MAESVPDKYLSGYPVQAAGSTRIVEIQNNSSKLWVYALASSSVGADDPTPPPAKADIVSGTDSEQPDPNQQWKLLLVDFGLQHYRVQNIGTHKYVSVGESPKDGANIQQSSNDSVWKIESKDNKSYTFTPVVKEGQGTIFWTHNKGDDQEPITVAKDAKTKSEWLFRPARS